MRDRRQSRCPIWRTEPSYAGWQRHHILPLCLLSYCDVSRLLGELSVSGFRLDCFARNSILLSSLDRTATTTGLPLHRGPHHRYDAVCAMYIDRIYVESRRSGAPPEAVLASVAAVQAGMRAVLSERRVGNPIVLSDRTYPIEDAFFAALDRKTDLLFDSWYRQEQPPCQASVIPTEAAV